MQGVGCKGVGVDDAGLRILLVTVQELGVGVEDVG